MLAERGVDVDHSTIYRWVQRYAPELDERCRSRWQQTHDSWRVDETYTRVWGVGKYLYRTVDSAENTLDFLLTARRDGKAAKRFFHRLLKGHGYVPRVLVTDKLRSYSAAHREVMPSVEHRRHKGLNNRAEAPTNPPDIESVR